MIKAKFKKAMSVISSRAKLISVIMAVVVLASTFPVQFVKAVSIQDGDNQFTVYSFGNDAEAILDSASIEIDEADEITVVESNASKSVMTIKINRAISVNLDLAGEVKEVKVPEGTVEEALKECGFIADKHDKITPSLDTQIQEGMDIKVVDVEYKKDVTTKTIEYKTKKIYTARLAPGETRISIKGKDGELTITKTTKTINGKTVKVETNKKVTKKAVTEEILVGIKTRKANPNGWISELTPKKTIELDRYGRPVDYKKVIKGVASAYCTGTTCSTGVKVKPGYIAVDPSIIPYGTEMYIRTPDGSWLYGYAIAADTGGFTSWGNTIADLYMSSYTQAVNFGRRNIEIYII